MREFLCQVISTKMCTCLWLKWGHAIPHRAKAKKAVALCPLGSRHDLHWSREKGNEIFASPAFLASDCKYCTLGNFKFTFMPSSSLHWFFKGIMENAIELAELVFFHISLGLFRRALSDSSFREFFQRALVETSLGDLFRRALSETSFRELFWRALLETSFGELFQRALSRRSFKEVFRRDLIQRALLESTFGELFRRALSESTFG